MAGPRRTGEWSARPHLGELNLDHRAVSSIRRSGPGQSDLISDGDRDPWVSTPGSGEDSESHPVHESAWRYQPASASGAHSSNPVGQTASTPATWGRPPQQRGQTSASRGRRSTQVPATGSGAPSSGASRLTSRSARIRDAARLSGRAAHRSSRLAVTGGALPLARDAQSEHGGELHDRGLGPVKGASRRTARKGGQGARNLLKQTRRRAGLGRNVRVAGRGASRPRTPAASARGFVTPTSASQGMTRSWSAGRVAQQTAFAVVRRLEMVRQAIAAAAAGLASSAPTMLVVAGVAVVLLLVMSLFSTLPGLGQQLMCQPRAQAVLVANVPESAAGFNKTQLTTAAVIAQTAKDVGLDRRAQLIGIMTAIQESQMGADPGSKTPNRDGDAGLFQHRTLPGWYGTVAQVNDPAYSSRAFYQGVTATAPGDYGSAGGGTGHGHLPGLIDVPGWQSLPLTIAAANVQRPSADLRDAYGQHEAAANAILDAISGATVETVTDLAPGDAEGVDAGGYQLGPVQPAAQAFANSIGPQFGIKTVGGWRSRSQEKYDPAGHPAGLALDLMIDDIPNGTAAGDGLAQYLQENASALGVKYLIWRQRSWNPQRGTWQTMDDRGSPTANHFDHVHVSLTGGVTGAAGPIPPADAIGCPGLGAAGVAQPAAVSVQGWAAPAAGPITSGFGGRTSPGGVGSTNHKGIDLGGGGCGGPIYAAKGGQVSVAGPASGYGHLIEIDNGQGLTTRYGHMYSSGVLVRPGQKVTPGQVIGQVGSDGRSTGCHLHFEVHSNGTPIDPLPVLQQSGGTIK